MSLVTSTVVHAQELSTPIAQACTAEMREEQNEKPAPGDADPAVPHQHGCHHASSFVIGVGQGEQMLDRAAALYGPASADVFVFRNLGPDLRPPIA
ncbi:hypothetical protein [Novosphingobium pentaromativorans]|nr:hypothetical protein [Novosphingobium pentaromativorans]